MERIAISRGEHPNEATAFFLALKVKGHLEGKGHEVDLITVPFTSTPFGKAIRGRDSYDKNWVRKTFRQTGARFLFSFHNSSPDIESVFIDEYFPRPKSDKKRLRVEIPAVYVQVTNPHVLKKIEAYINSKQVGRIQRKNYAEDYMLKVANIPESIRKGLMDDNIVQEIAESIINYITEAGVENEN